MFILFLNFLPAITNTHANEEPYFYIQIKNIFLQKTEKAEKLDVKKVKGSKAEKEKNYDLPEIPDYERAVLEKPQEFEFSEYGGRDKTKLERPTTQKFDSSVSKISTCINDSFIMQSFFQLTI